MSEATTSWRARTRRVVGALLWSLAVLSGVAVINVIGVRFFGDVKTWQDWLSAHRLHCFLWRVCLYAATAYGWWWMRKRLRAREPDPHAHMALRRAEVAAVVSVLVLEISVFLTSP